MEIPGTEMDILGMFARTAAAASGAVRSTRVSLARYFFLGLTGTSHALVVSRKPHAGFPYGRSAYR
jgi:hypothetical protein